MKNLVFLILFAGLGCSCAPKAPGDLVFQGEATSFYRVPDNPFAGKPVVEASLLNMGGEIVAFYDPNWSGSMHRATLGVHANGFDGGELVNTESRFQYTLEYQGRLYTFATVDGDIYLSISEDGGFTWFPGNGDEPVLVHSPDPTSIYHNLWNVGVDVDENGTWHLVVESGDSSPNQLGVGIAYSTATMINGRLDFNQNKSATHVIPKGGNPWIKSMPGGNLLVIHGQAHTPEAGFGSEWFVTASAFVSGEWKIDRSKFRIGTPGVHVCDPHVVEQANGQILMALSFDQGSIAMVRAPMTLTTLMQKIGGL